MMRFAFAAAVLAAVSACQPSPAEQQLSAACQAGNTQACGVLLAQQQARQQAFSAALTNTGQSLQAMSAPPAIRPMGMTSCRPVYGGGFNCSSW